ncbi:MAG: hypothetical protein Q9165_008335 [Trypethelium subeluteriae]
MANLQRFFGQVLTNLSSQSVFSGEEEKRRTDVIRKGIQTVRHSWRRKDTQAELRQHVVRFVESHHQKPNPELWEYLNGIVGNFDDYVDMREGEMSAPRHNEYTAVEFYCSQIGYDFLFSLISQLLREDHIEDNALVAAATLVEYLTIELYNLRLSNLGDPRYANFQGVTHRGMNVSPEVAEEYRRIADREDIRQRNFAVPLALVSTTTSSETMQKFAASEESDTMHWIIHIYGLDPQLYQIYHEKYPDGIVTSICATPVGHISAFGEQEILLRGAFFHIISMRSETAGSRQTHTIEIMMLNTNRDHGTELSANEGDKKEQRDFFGKIIRASRYEICASLAREISTKDTRAYEELAEQELEAIGASGLGRPTYDTAFTKAISEGIPTWLGASREFSHPRQYVRKRLHLQRAAGSGDWATVEEVLSAEYDWKKKDWFSVPKLLTNDANQNAREEYTLVHELARCGPPEGNAHQQEAWQRLVKAVEDLGAWRTVKTFDIDRKTPFDIASENGLDEMYFVLRPKIKHPIPEAITQELQSQLHSLMMGHCGEILEEHVYRLPQLSVLTEMSEARMWVPVPSWYGGFLLEIIDTGGLKVTVFHGARESAAKDHIEEVRILRCRDQ